MKILLVSNAPWASTGYGTQTASLARRLRDAGHKVVLYCQYGLNGGTHEWEGIPCLPTGMQGGYNDPIIRGHLRYTQPDLVITLFDIWALDKTEIPQWIRESGAKWLAWTPIDAVPVSLATRMVLPYVDYPVMMSNFAEKAIHAFDPEYRVEVIPHGIEKDFGYTANGRQEFRRSIQVPDDAFLFGTVGRNAYYPGRKGLDRLIRAFAEADIENSYLYIHTGKWSESGSMPIEKVVAFYAEQHPGLEDRIKFPDEYNLVMGYSQVGMNALYSALDCYVQPTLGEGFGLPVMEAQACGCAVIATDCTSMPDIVCPHSSELIPGATEILVPDPSHRVLIDIEKLKDAMGNIAGIKRDDPSGFLAMKGNAGLWANGWDWDRLWEEYWKPFLAKIEEDVEKLPMRDWHRGGATVFEREGVMRKQEHRLGSPVVAKCLTLLNRLSHPNLIPILEQGKTDEGLSYYDMPKYTPLRELSIAALTDAERNRIIDGVRSALEYLHSKGVAHRDVAPENVVVDELSNPYLIDFEWAHPCDGTIGVDCVDFEPWAVPARCVPIVQTGMEQRGFHTIVNYVRQLGLENKTHGFKGIPYQAVDGVGERDCETRWKLMNPDVYGKRVADVGCNLGWFLRRAWEEGASAVWGIDNDEAVVRAARELDPIGNYVVTDLNTTSTGIPRADVIFCLSVLQHLETPDRVFDVLLERADTLYIEIPARFITAHMAETLKDADYLGESERGRPLYRVKVREAVLA